MRFELSPRLVRLVAAAAFVLASRTPAAVAQAIPRPEHPNPQLQREQWQNLNGAWDFWEGDACDEAAALARTEFPDQIVVPFCRESALSGLGRKAFVKNVVYRRTLAVPADWSVGPATAGAPGGRVLLHVGACDWRTVIWLNGKRVGFHEGGSAPITCDVTEALDPAPGAKNELRVWAFDDTRSKLQQCGKQSNQDESYGCVYTRTTGIWQTVWMERVGKTFIDQIEMRTLVHDELTHGKGLQVGQHVFDDGGSERSATIQLSIRLLGPCQEMRVGAYVKDGESAPIDHALVLATTPRTSVELTIPRPKLWNLTDPRLYQLEITVYETPADERNGIHVPQKVDSIATYVGIRDVTIDGLRVLLNGKPVFQRTILDQGFYPDGIWTAPSDAALKHDIEMCMAAGFNGARLHQKVFEPRFHYWADKLGYLTWGEAPSWGNDDANPASHRVVLQEWTEILERDRNHPSIVGWCPFNETGNGSGPLQNAATAITRAIDPTRLVLDTSGYTHSDPARDVDDAHDYDQDPKSFRARWWPSDGADSLPARYGVTRRDRPFFVSEFGGIGWKQPGDPGWGYGNDPKSEAEWYVRFQGLCDAQLDNPSLFGFCYTQLTDVEQERNGLYYYDRRPKFDVAKLHAIVARKAAIEAEPTASAKPVARDWKVVLPSAVDAPDLPWSYLAATTPLKGDDWKRGVLGDAAKPGKPGFGKKDGFDLVIGTPWTTSDLYLARTFDWSGEPFERALLVLHYDNAATICVNGEQLLHRDGWNDRYEPVDVTERARALLKRGANVIAVHVHQDGGGQYFDAALLVAPVALSR